MFLKKNTYKNGRTFLSIVESFRDENGKPKHRIIKKIGYLDELSDLYDDPVAYFSGEAKKMTKLKKDESFSSVSLDFNSSIDLGNNLYNVGYLPYKYIYNELGLSQFFLNKQRRLDIMFSLDKCLQLLSFSRILYPGSKKSTFENRHTFFEQFNNITLDAVYDSLDYFNKYKEEIQSLLWENTKDSYQRDVSKSYYDCTNYYFDIEYNDDDIFDDEGNIIEKGLRKRGPKKIIDLIPSLKWDFLWMQPVFLWPMTFFQEMNLKKHL